MSVADQLAEAAKNQTVPETPPLGAAPQSPEDVTAAQQAFAEKQQGLAVNKMRFEQLSGAIFARLFAESGVMESALNSETGEVDQKVLNPVIQLCNILSSHAAMGHATAVWQIQVQGQQPTPPPAVPAQQLPAS